MVGIVILVITTGIVIACVMQIRHVQGSIAEMRQKERQLVKELGRYDDDN